MNIIEIENLSFRYPGAEEDTLRNVNLAIEEGDFVAVVGGNGSGKTTMCKTLNGLIPHYWSGDFAGTVLVDGVDTYESSVAQLSATVGYVYQDFQNQLVRPTVGDEVSFGPINFARRDWRERTGWALDVLGIDALSDRFVWQLSGGQAHLTAVASVLALRPKVVVVDEPIAELDPARAVEVYDRLRELNEKHGLTVITIEHNAEFIARYAKSVVLMADGSPVWHLPVDEAMNRIGELTEHGIPAPQIVQACHALGVTRAPRTVETAAEALRTVGFGRPEHDVVRPPELAAHGTREVDDAEPEYDGIGDGVEFRELDDGVVAKAVGLRHAYRSIGGGLTPVLDGVDLTLHEGDQIALVGGNGSGKTTLLRLLAGIIVAREGNVYIEGINTRSKQASELSDHVAYLYQHPEQMFLKPSIHEDISLYPAERNLAGWRQHVDDVLRRVRLEEFADRDGRMLSGGQQRRATLGIGLAMAPTVILLDEPTSSLDVTSRDDVTNMLMSLSDTIKCAVVATHDMQLVAEWATRVIVLERGRIAADVTPRELFARPELMDRANLVPPQITQLGAALGVSPLPLNVSEFVRSIEEVTVA